MKFDNILINKEILIDINTVVIESILKKKIKECMKGNVMAVNGIIFSL